jgi:hypothetical protein
VAILGEPQQRPLPYPSPNLCTIRLRAFHTILRDQEYGEGQNVEIEYRGGEGPNNRLQVPPFRSFVEAAG